MDPNTRVYIANVNDSLEEFKSAFLEELWKDPSVEKMSALQQVLSMFMLRYIEVMATTRVVCDGDYV